MAAEEVNLLELEAEGDETEVSQTNTAITNSARSYRT